MTLLSSRLPPLCLALFLLVLSIDGTACSGRLHIEVQDAGVYALDYAAIVAQQPALADCAAQDLVLFNRGKEVPIRVSANGDGRFAAGSRIQWVGQSLHGPQSWYDQYSAVNGYLLGAAPGAHARMRELADSAPRQSTTMKPASLRRSQHFEQENLMLRLNDRQMQPGDEPDVWQWVKLTPIDTQPFTFNFDLADVDLTKAQGDADVALTLNFRGVSNVFAAGKTAKPVDHIVQVLLNGKQVASLQWEGRDEMRKVLNLSRSVLRQRGNAISLRVPKRPSPIDPKNFIVDVAMFNWMEVSYPVRGNLSTSGAMFTATANAPVEVEDAASTTSQLFGSDGTYRAMTALGGHRFRAAAADTTVDLYPVRDGKTLSPALLRAVAEQDMHADAVGEDYVIVAHPRLLQAILPLAQYHREHGHTVAVLNVDDIYDQFNDGIAHPVAIRNLIAWGMQHWANKPRYLLLVGDASADIHHDVRTDHSRSKSAALRPEPFREELLMQGGLSAMPTTSYSQWAPDLANRNLIPTWQFPSYEGQAASDNGFVALTAGDFHPQLAVGRLPVIEPAEVTAIVDKTLAYLSKPTPGPWRRDVTFISTDEVASFKVESDKIASDLSGAGFAVNSIYTKLDAKEAVNAHAELKHDLDAGNLLVHFLGHGGAFIWRVGPPADLFTLDDISHLRNAGRYPMVLAMTCFSAPFDNPTEDSIGERFLREADKGAVAVFAASWTNSPNPATSKILVEQLLKPGMPIGDAIVTTKAKMKDRVFVEMYNLLGDPALVLTRPDAPLAFARTADRWNPQVLVRVPTPDFAGEVDVDWLDGSGKILAAQHYQARDPQFFLTPVDKAAQVRVYAADSRNGRSAFGGFSLEPPKPIVAAAVPRPKAQLPKMPAPAKSAPNAPASNGGASNGAGSVPAATEPATQPMRPGKQPDTIKRTNFDADAVRAAA